MYVVRLPCVIANEIVQCGIWLIRLNRVTRCHLLLCWTKGNMYRIDFHVTSSRLASVASTANDIWPESLWFCFRFPSFQTQMQQCVSLQSQQRRRDVCETRNASQILFIPFCRWSRTRLSAIFVEYTYHTSYITHMHVSAAERIAIHSRSKQMHFVCWTRRENEKKMRCRRAALTRSCARSRHIPQTFILAVGAYLAFHAFAKLFIQFLLPCVSSLPPSCRRNPFCFGSRNHIILIFALQQCEEKKIQKFASAVHFRWRDSHTELAACI